MSVRHIPRKIPSDSDDADIRKQHHHLSETKLENMNMRKGMFLVAAWLLSALPLLSQSSSWEVHDLPGASETTAMTVDQRGWIWAGTPEGLFRYDGTEWAHYTTENNLPDNHIQSLTVDQNGNVWIGTSKGMATLDPSGNIDQPLPDSITGESITALYSLADNFGTMMWGTAEGDVYAYQEVNNDFLVMLPLTAAQLGKVTSITAVFAPFSGTADGWLFVFRSTAGLIVTSTDFSIQVPVNTSSSNILPSNNILCGVEVNDVVYDGTANGLYVAGFDNGSFRTENQGLPDLRVQALAYDGADVWVGTPKGLARKDPMSGAVSQVITTSNSNLPDNDIRVLIVDNDSNLWAGTADGSVSMRVATSGVETREASTIAMTLSPNPTQDQIAVNFTSAAQSDALIEIVDQTGRVIRKEEHAINPDMDVHITVDVRDLSTGLYYCRLTSGDLHRTLPFHVFGK